MTTKNQLTHIRKMIRSNTNPMVDMTLDQIKNVWLLAKYFYSVRMINEKQLNILSGWMVDVMNP